MIPEYFARILKWKISFSMEYVLGLRIQNTWFHKCQPLYFMRISLMTGIFRILQGQPSGLSSQPVDS